MSKRSVKGVIRTLGFYILGGALFGQAPALAADKRFTIYTARVMSQSYPWIAEEAGLFKKYDLDIPLVFVTPGAPAVAAILSGDSEVAVIGAASITRPFVQGNKDPVLIGGVKSLLTHSIIAKPDIKTPEQLRGKRIGVSRIGSNPALFRCPSSASLWFGQPRRELYSGWRSSRDPGRAGCAGHRCRSIDCPDRRSGSQVGLSLRCLRPGPAHRVCRDYSYYPPVDHRQARAGDGSLQCAPWLRPPRSCTRTKNTFTRFWAKYLRIDDRKLLEGDYNVEIKSLGAEISDQA